MAKKKRESKNYTWREICGLTDCYSESLFALAQASANLESCVENVSWSIENLGLNDKDGSGNLVERIKKAERKLNAEIKKWEDDPVFQAEIKVRLEVLRIQKKSIETNLEKLKERVPYLLQLISDFEQGNVGDGLY